MVTSPHPSMCLILRLPKQLICLHSLLVYLKCCLGVGSVSTRYVYTDKCFCVYMIEKAKTRVGIRPRVYCVRIYERLFKTFFYSEAHCSR